MKRGGGLFLAALIALLALALWRERAELRTVAATLPAAQPFWLALAATAQGLYLFLYLTLHRAALRAVSVDLPLRVVADFWARALAVNAAAPGAGNALFVAEAARRGVPPARAASGLTLVRIADLSGFALVLAAGLGSVGLRGRLLPGEAAATGALALLVGLWSLPLLLALWRPRWLDALFAGLERLGLCLRMPGKPGWAGALSRDARATALSLAGDPGALWRLIGLSWLAHLADLASFALVLAAFGAGFRPGLALAGFGAAVLFWIVTVTPEGIGTSEGAAALALHGRGLPLATATAVAVAFRGLAFYLPLSAGVGIALVRRLRPSVSLRLVPPALATATAVAGGVNLLSAVQPALRHRAALLAPIVPGILVHGSRLASAFSGFALLVLSVGLARRKRSAWALAQGVLLLSIVSHLGKGLDVEEASVSLAALVSLLIGRAHFHARSDTPTMKRGLTLLAAALGFTLAYGTAGFFLLDAHYRVHFSLPAALDQTIEMFVAFRDPHLEPTTGYGAWFADSIYLVAAGALGYGLLALLAPVLLRRPASPAEREKAREIVARYGRSSVARFTLFDDKSYWFSPGGSVVAYAVAGRVAVALGEPIGPAADAASALKGFCTLAEKNDWIPAFYHIPPETKDLCAAAGLTTLCIGYEAVVDLDDFSLAGGARKSLRRHVARAEERGYRAQVLDAPHSDALLSELEAVSDAWLETRGGKEKQFSLGWFDRAYLQEGPVAVARDPGGRLVAFANVLPAYQSGEATIDLMRRSETESAVMELLFLALFAWARARGFRAFNLGLAPLAGIGESSDDPAIDRAIRFLYDHLNGYYGFQGLRAFKEKFAPRWEPRYLAVPGLAAVPAASLAVVRADNGNAPLWRLALRR